ncbi:MAG: ParA family protein [Planctomycetes bacterium]|nr:ParA family protein [Planctomycetota bacterium]
MTQVIAVVNPKGGVGKTTTAIHVSAGLAVAGSRVLLVDLDPQAHATRGLGLGSPAKRGGGTQPFEGLSPVLGDLEGARVLERIRPTRVEGLSVLTACGEGVGAEDELRGRTDRTRGLTEVLSPVASRFDFALVDTPPGLGLLPLMALVSADGVLSPVHCGGFALEGLADLLQAIRRVRQHENPRLSLLGLVLTLYQDEVAACREVAEEVRAYLPRKVCRTVVPRDPALVEAALRGLSILEHDVCSRGANAYIELTKEVLGYG